MMHVACGEVITCGDCSFRTRAGERPELDIISATWRENTQRGGRYGSKAGGCRFKGGQRGGVNRRDVPQLGPSSVEHGTGVCSSELFSLY